MPFIELKTNIELTNSVKEELKQSFGKDIEILHKTESWLMINFIDNQSMYFKGSNSPCVIVEVKLYGSVNDNLASKFTEAITSSVSSKTGIEKNRVYVNYFGTDNWGYSGFNF